MRLAADALRVTSRRSLTAAVWLLLAAAAFAGMDYGRAIRPGGLSDWQDFEFGARVLLGWTRYAAFGGPRLQLYVNNPSIQIGPPSLLLVAALQGFKSQTALWLATALMTLLGLAGFGSIVRACSAPLSALSPSRRPLTILAGGLPVLFCWGYLAGLWAHVDDLIAVALAAMAAPLIAKGKHWWLVGLLLGTSAASKPWAVVFIPMLLGLPRRDWAKAVLAVFVGAGIWWAPFVLADHATVSAVGGYPVSPSQGSVLWLLGSHGPVQRWLRPVQFIGGVTVASIAARRTGWRSAALAGLAFRVATDPYIWLYYALGPILMATVWDFGRDQGSKRRLGWVPAVTLLTLIVEMALPVWATSGLGSHVGSIEFRLDLCAAAKLAWAAGMLWLTIQPLRRTQLDGSSVDTAELPETSLTAVTAAG